MNKFGQVHILTLYFYCIGTCFIFVVSLGQFTFFDLNLKHCPALSLKITLEEFVNVGYIYTILFSVPNIYEKNKPIIKQNIKIRKET
jgi:hypothetical protein